MTKFCAAPSIIDRALSRALASPIRLYTWRFRPKTQILKEGRGIYLRSACPSSGILKEYRNTGQDNPEFRKVSFGLSECELFPAATPLPRLNRNENPGRTNDAKAGRQSV